MVYCVLSYVDSIISNMSIYGHSVILYNLYYENGWHWAGENWNSLMIDYSVRPPNCDNHLHPYCQDSAGNEVSVNHHKSIPGRIPDMSDLEKSGHTKFLTVQISKRDLTLSWG